MKSSPRPDSPDGFHPGILEYMLEGCQILDHEWRYLYLNPTAQVHSRREPGELLGQRFQDMWPGIESTELFALIRRTLEERVPTSMENLFTYPDGNTGWFELRMTPVPEGVFIMSLDISERKQSEDTLLAMEHQLMQSQKLEAVGLLAGGVAHDFNNMLGVILGHVELALERVHPDDPILADLTAIQQASMRSADLTRQLLGFARKQTVAPRTFDVSQQIQEFLPLLGRVIGEDIELEWCPAAEPALVCMDPVQVEQILSNLCINARDAIASVGRITIEVSTVHLDEAYCRVNMGFLPGQFVRLTVSDTGAGMERTVVDRIFEPFFSTKALGQGTGLGLATVYGIVKQNQGFINVYSEPGQGSSFRIYLTLDAQGSQPENLAEGHKEPTQGYETILLVEDEESILSITTRMLESLGYHVLPVASPQEALELVGRYQGPIHLMLTDVIMPGMTGPELGSRILESNPDISLVYMSGYTANVVAHRGVLKPGIEFLPKPFSRQQLGAKVREVLGVREGGSGTQHDSPGKNS
ncbi:MAG: response regulator [Candidatus Cloacimonetes bacterium]|nr:response regulator [Candidatus Cloacimonadota bacterium]